MYYQTGAYVKGPIKFSFTKRLMSPIIMLELFLITTDCLNKGEFPNTQPHVGYGDGDGTVNRRSLEGCSKWSQRQSYDVTQKQYSSVNHNGMLSDENVLSNRFPPNSFRSLF